MAYKDTTDSALLDLRQKANCILLKVLPDSNFNEEIYHNNLVYYPFGLINCDDTKEVILIKKFYASRESLTVEYFQL
jgi:hypothetical protein